jgi:hypothetical protein
LDGKESDEAAASLFRGEAPELSAESAVDPFAVLQGMEADFAVTTASPDSDGPFQGTDPEWLFTEPGEDTASLLAHADPIEDSVIPEEVLPADPFDQPEGLLELDLVREHPAQEEAPPQEPSVEPRAEIPAAFEGVPKLHMVAGQVLDVNLVIAERTYRLRIQLEQID